MSGDKQKTAIIIGGTGDIGLATAKIFQKNQIRPIVTGRQQSRVDQRVGELSGNAEGLQLDPSNELEIRKILQKVGQFEYLVLTLGTQSQALPFEQLSDDDYQRSFNEKFFFYIRALRASLGLVSESVTWLTGSAGRCALPGLSNYGATCGALHGALFALSAEIAPVRLNCVASGIAKTDFWKKLGMTAQAQDAMYEEANAQILTGKVAEPNDIAEAIYFAATNRYTTGTVMDTCGGLQLGRAVQSDKKAAFGGQNERLK